MANPPAGFVARAMCALAAASLIAAPVMVNADAGAPTKHKGHKKSYKKKGVARKGKHKRKRSANYMPKTQTVTTTTTTPAPPPPPPPPPPPLTKNGATLATIAPK